MAVNLDSNEKYVFKKDGKEFELREPTMGDLEKFELKKSELEDTKKANKKSQDFLELIGLPKGLYRKLTPAQVTAIMDTITNKKK